jgi:hypothetical protein
MTGSRPNGFKESGLAGLALGRRPAQESSESEYGTFSGLVSGERQWISAIFQDVYGIVT